MPPPLALGLCALLILWLYKRDLQLSNVSHALWIPLAWILLIGSRFPSEWLSGPAQSSMAQYADGSALDRNVFLGLIILGFIVLCRRHVSFRSFLSTNVLIVLFFAFTATSLLWSDFPMVAFKRWHKVLGHVIMALVVLTDPQPSKAFESLFRRCAYILVPVSVTLLKYYPQMARGFDSWSGAPVNTGITLNKNLLGNVCLICGMFLVTILFMRARRDGATKLDRAADFGMAGMTVWLLQMAQSATSLACLLLGATIIVATQFRSIAKTLSIILIVVAVTGGLLEVSFHLREKVILALGRDTTLTGRTELWETLEKIPTNPVIGTGFESFWLGERAEGIWAKYWWRPNQAHNGYYETYLNLGYVGVALQLGMMFAAYLTARRKTKAAMKMSDGDSREFAFARFATGYVISLAAYNFTEATFKALHLSFFVFFLIAIEYAMVPQEATAEQPKKLEHAPSKWQMSVAPAPLVGQTTGEMRAARSRSAWKPVGAPDR